MTLGLWSGTLGDCFFRFVVALNEADEVFTNFVFNKLSDQPKVRGLDDTHLYQKVNVEQKSGDIDLDFRPSLI